MLLVEAIYITFLIYVKDIYGEKNERNQFFNPCHSLLDIAWPLLLRSWSRLHSQRSDAFFFGRIIKSWKNSCHKQGSAFLLIRDWISPETSGKKWKKTTFEYVIHNHILVSQMCKQQNFHLSLLTMQQQQQRYIVSKARYSSYFTGYLDKYNWLSGLFVLFSDYEQEEVQRLLWIPGINLDEKHPCTCPQTVKRTYHLRDVRAALFWTLVGNCGRELLLGACKWIFLTDNVASQKKHMAAAKQWNLCKLG